MAHILVNAVSAKSGGAATYAANLARHFASIGSPHRFIFYVPADLQKSVSSTNGQVVVVATTIGTTPSWRRFVWDQFTLRGIIKRERIDILISSSDFGMISPPCRQLLFIRNALFFSPFYSRSILPQQSWRARLAFRARKWLVLLSAKFSDVVMTASLTMLNDFQLRTRSSHNTAVVNYLGVPLERFVPQESSFKTQLEDASKPFRLLHVSTYSDYKNLTTLLKAIRILAEQEPPGSITLTTTADPWQFPDVEVVSRKEDQSLAAHPCIVPFVKFTGTIAYEDIARFYANHDLFVFPSLVESFGHPLVEAMASGLPILAADIPICREVCGDAALYFSAFDPADLGEKILLLRRDPQLRRQLGEAGRKRAEKQFDWKDHVRRLVELIEQVRSHART
ncbi:MAG: hypothetical protein C5B60_07200 [Chloroflexi bacterium]|nr:MAG: hypothetical protein C5B60_07200 [Chloroflexota bacterium]